MRSSVRTTRWAGKLKSTSIANSSRLKSSTTLNVRKRRSPHNASLIKSADQHSFIASLTTNGAGHLVGKRFLPFLLLFSFRLHTPDRRVCDSSDDRALATAETTCQSLVLVGHGPAPTVA